MHENTVQFPMTALLMLNCNSCPNYDDTKDGLARRLYVLKWLMKFCENPDERNKYQKLIDRELETRFSTQQYGAVFLRMVLLNLVRLKTEKAQGKRKTLVVHPKSVVCDSAEHRLINNPLEQFWARCYRPSARARSLQVTKVWENFQNWLLDIRGESGIDWKKDPRYQNIRQGDLSNFLLAKCGPQQRDAHNQKGYMGYRESTDDEVFEYLNPIEPVQEMDQALLDGVGPSARRPRAASDDEGPSARRPRAASDDDYERLNPRFLR